MAIVELDTLSGSQARHHIEHGWTITRTAIVRNLNPSEDPTDIGLMLEEAEAALVPYVGYRGDPCPNISVPTYLEQFVPEILDTHTIRFQIIYRGYPLPTYELDTSLSQVESNLDASSELIILYYTYPSGYSWDKYKAGKEFDQGGMVSRPMPEMSFTVRFIVTGGYVGATPVDATEAATLFAMFTGCINDDTYTIGLVEGSARQWMITRVRGVSRDGGVSYEMSMTFQFRRETWDQLVVFINPDYGRPPPDLGPEGQRIVQVATLATFPTFVFGTN